MVAPMSKRRCGVGVAVLNDLLYAVGGHDGQVGNAAGLSYLTKVAVLRLYHFRCCKILALNLESKFGKKTWL
jgi:Kelch motif